MNPESRPISFTRPIPLRARLRPRCWPQYVARRASVTAVSNPKVFCTNETSLSIVFGMPITLIARPRRAASSPIFCAPRSVPSPPMAKRMPTRRSFSVCDHLRRILRPARGAEDRSTDLMDPVDGVWRQLERLVPVPPHEAFVAETEPVHRLSRRSGGAGSARSTGSRRSVPDRGRRTSRSRTRASTDRRTACSRGPATSIEGGSAPCVQPRLHLLEPSRDRATRSSSLDEADAGHRRREAALAEPRDREIEIAAHACAPS